MAHVDVEINFEKVAQELNYELKIGYKRVTLTDEKSCIEADIIDLENTLARAKWITTKRSADIDYKDVVSRLEEVMANDDTAEIVRQTKFQMLQEIVETGDTSQLSEQELEIVDMVKSGASLDEIAETLGIARSTVEDKIRGRKGKPGILEKMTVPAA